MNHKLPWVAERVRLFHESDADIGRWARGFGPIVHNDQTQLRVHDLAQVLVAGGKAGDTANVYLTLWAADRLTVAGMLFANRCTWAHVTAEAASALGIDAAQVLRADEWAAVRGLGDPQTVMTAE
jgi:hypothetical protein